MTPLESTLPRALRAFTCLCGRYRVAARRGELDNVSVPELRDQLLGLLRPDARRLIVDLSHVSFSDASGLAVLVGTTRRARLLGGVLRLAAPTPPTIEALRITGLDLHLEIFPTVSAAIIDTKASLASPMADGQDWQPGK
jgi:anti-sigma B factor antagonist